MLIYLNSLKSKKTVMPVPTAISNTYKVFCENVYSFMNVGIILCTFIESYIFPFAIIKWVIIITKYGGLSRFLGSDQSNTLSRTRYKYSLELMTSCERSRIESNEQNLLSHISVVMEAACGQYYWIQVREVLETVPILQCLRLLHTHLLVVVDLKFIHHQHC